MNKKIFFLIIALVFFAGFAILISKKDTESQRTVHENKNDNIENKTEPLQIKLVTIKDLEDVGIVLGLAEEEGFFKKNNLEVETSEVSGVATKVLLSGQADVSFIGISGALGAYFNGAEPRWIATPFTLFTHYGVSRFDKENFEQIKKVGVTGLGIEPHLVSLIGLEKMGVNPDSIQFLIAKGNSPKLALLEKEEIDFATISPFSDIKGSPYLEKYNIIAPQDLTGGSGLVRGITTTEKVLEEKKEELEKFVRSVYETLEYIEENPEDTKSYMQEKFSYSNERAEQMYSQLIVSKSEVSFVPDERDIDNLVNLVKEHFKPEMPKREIEAFIIKDLARDAIQGEK